MGWANVPADQMWVIVRPHIDPYSRPDVAKKILEALGCTDCEQLQTDATAEHHEIKDDWDFDDMYGDDDDFFDYDFEDFDRYEGDE